MKKILSIMFFLCLINFVQAQDESTRKEHYNLKKTVAISGYDPVSYFSANPSKGNENFTHTYKGITYHFVNEKNKKTFIASPVEYEPAYGGWCASAMGGDNPHKVGINPETYKIIDNKLYLFYNKLGINTLKSWNKGDQTEKIKSGNNNWKTIISK